MSKEKNEKKGNKNLEKKVKININKKKIIIISSCVFLVLIAFILFLFLRNSSKKDLNLSDFEKIAVYGYLEDYFSLDELYLKAGISSYDNTQFINSKVKEILVSHYEKNKESTVSASTILSELSDLYNISDNTIDFRAIVVSDYEYEDEKSSFVRKEGANSGVSYMEFEVKNINENSILSVTNIKKSSNDNYDVYFNVVDSINKDYVLNSGVVTIKIENNSYVIESCSFNN